VVQRRAVDAIDRPRRFQEPSDGCVPDDNRRVGGSQDWRLRGQEEYLDGARLIKKPYRAVSETSEHQHCEFCWAKFMDPGFSPVHAAAVANDPSILTAGYTVLGGRTIHGPQDDYWWICPRCVSDFRERFHWTVLDLHTS